MAIKDKEIYDGALAASRAQAEWESPMEPHDPTSAGSPSLASGRSSSSCPGSGEVTPAAPRGGKRGRPPKPPFRPSTSGRARAVLRNGPTLEVIQ